MTWDQWFSCGCAVISSGSFAASLTSLFDSNRRLKQIKEERLTRTHWSSDKWYGDELR